MIPANAPVPLRDIRTTIVQAARGIAGTLTLLVSCAVPLRAQSAPERAPDDPFARRAWHLDIGGHAAFETWNYNTSREEMIGLRAGLTYGIGNGIVLLAGAPLYHVAQRGVDGYLLGVTGGIRGRVYRKGRVSAFLEAEVGVSESDTYVPPRGTRFNYLALGSAGVTVHLRRGAHLLAGMKWIHVSNNGLAGRHRNPDIEAVGPYASLLIPF